MLGAIDAVRSKHGVGVQLVLPVKEDQLQPQLRLLAQLIQVGIQGSG